MVAALVPYRWVTDDGMPHWRASGNVTSAVDLRPLALMPDPNSVGYAVAMVEGELPDGAVAFTGNVTRDRDAWKSALGFRPAGNTVEEMAWSQLTDGADDAGEAACRPLRCSRPDRLELHLGGKHERQTTNTERLKQAVLIRNDLARMVDDERIPRKLLGKFLQAEADRMGIDAITLRGKAAKLKDIRPERPETTITDSFYNTEPTILLSAYTPSGAAGPWTTAGSDGSRFRTGNIGGTGSKVTFNGTSYVGATTRAFHPTSLSSANSYAQLEDMPRQDSPTMGPMCRSDGSNSNYFADVYYGNNRCYVWVSGTPTLIGNPAAAAGSVDTPWVRAIASAIAWGHVVGTSRGTATNTAVSAGLRTGILGDDAVGSTKEANGFYARDYLTPTVSSIDPSSGPLAGGTAVTITGTGFEAGATVTIGGASATSVVVVSDTSITAVTPSGTAGAKDVVATNADSGLTGTLAGGFTYAPGGASTLSISPTRRRR
jgi:hypothetical protein